MALSTEAWVGVAAIAVTVVLTVIGWTRRSRHAKGAARQSVQAGRDAIVAGRDIRLDIGKPPTPPPLSTTQEDMLIAAAASKEEPGEFHLIEAQQISGAVVRAGRVAFGNPEQPRTTQEAKAEFLDLIRRGLVHHVGGVLYTLTKTGWVQAEELARQKESS